jgi:hypothetical protein
MTEYVPAADAGPTEREQSGYDNDGTPIVVHDLLCPCTAHPHYGPTDNLRSACVMCQCWLISKIVERTNAEWHAKREHTHLYQYGREDASYAVQLLTFEPDTHPDDVQRECARAAEGRTSKPLD